MMHRLVLLKFVVFLSLQAAGLYAGTEDSSTAVPEEQKAAHVEEKVERIVIKNAHLIGRRGGVEDVLVNIRIVDGKLNVVTQDDISHATATIAVDAEKGFLMGNLQIGAPPSFVVLDENPRQNFDIFLNTGAHVRFAMEKGVVVMNELPDLPVSSADSPPGMSLRTAP